MRYDQLTLACYLAQPDTILEIGTWNGNRALALLHAFNDPFGTSNLVIKILFALAFFVWHSFLLFKHVFIERADA